MAGRGTMVKRILGSFKSHKELPQNLRTVGIIGYPVTANGAISVLNLI